MTDRYLALFEDAQRHWDKRHREMHAVTKAFNDEVVVPLPELDSIEKSAVPNLVQQACTHMADALASVEPNLSVEPLRPGIQKSEERARATAGALRWWMKKSGYSALTHQRAFWLPAYGMAPIVVLPDANRGFSRWEVRNPLTAYPCPPTNPGEVVAPWAFFRFTKTAAWWAANHPDAWASLAKGTTQPRPTDMFEGLEYLDDKERVVLLLGRKEPWDHSSELKGCVEVSRAANRTGTPWVVVPHRTTLDRALGQFDGMLGMHTQQALLMSLAYIAAKKSVFADPYLEGDNPQLVEVGDGLTGKVGQVKGGRMTYHRPDAVAAQMLVPMMSLLERNQRTTGNVPAQWGGEQPANVRTGRGASELLDATVDGAMASYHRALADSLAAEAEIALIQAKTYWPNVSRQFHVTGKNKTRGDYTPAETFQNCEVDVTYAVAGADAQTLTVMAGQLLGVGALATEDVMELHPLVQDVERTKDRMVVERLERAALSGFEQQVAAGEFPWEDVANLLEAVKSNKMNIWDAIREAQRKAQERQAAQVEPSDPSAQPGLNMPGMGAEAGGVIPGLGPEQQDLTSLLHQMHATDSAMGPG